MSIQELEEWFKTAPAPAMPVYLDAANRVNDYAQFVNSHVDGAKADNNDPARNPLIGDCKR